MIEYLNSIEWLGWIFEKLYTSGGLLGAALFVIIAIKILKKGRGQ